MAVNGETARSTKVANNDAQTSRVQDFTPETTTRESPPRNNVSFTQYFLADLTRGYLLENDGSRYAERREKVYTFMRMPREVEKFMVYGIFQCVDAFLFVFTFLPLRFVLALWFLVKRLVQHVLGKQTVPHQRLLQPAEICDLLKGVTIIVCSFMMTYIDTSMLYHLIKSQSVIKLYIFFNMLEVADRLFSAFGQDLLDTLFWTATEPRDRKREHFGVLSHLTLAILYVFLHSMLVLFQATTLNVAINSSNKALLTIMMSNNFVELKGSVFKKFEKNNLFQMSCSDVRERFHYVLLLVTVIVQTMKEYAWKEDRFWILAPDCLMVLFSEILVDWVKHAFITRFNEIPLEVYKDYTVSLAYDIATSKHKHAFSDHSDLVSRRMGFIPLPLGVLVFRIVSQSVKIQGALAFACLAVGYFCLVTLKVLNSIILLGIACDLIENHRHTKQQQPTPTSSKISLPRAKSHPPSRKASVERLSAGSLSHSISLIHQTNLLGSLGDISAQMENQETLGPRPLFSNSTVSLNSLGANDGTCDKCDNSGLGNPFVVPAPPPPLQVPAPRVLFQEMMQPLSATEQQVPTTVPVTEAAEESSSLHLTMPAAAHLRHRGPTTTPSWVNPSPILDDS